MRRISNIPRRLWSKADSVELLDKGQARLASIIAAAFLLATGITIAPAGQVQALADGDLPGALGLIAYLLGGAVLSGVLAGAIERKPPIPAACTAAALEFSKVRPHLAAAKARVSRFGKAVLKAARRKPQTVKLSRVARIHVRLHSSHRASLHRWTPGTHPRILYQ